jgi:hypothetical protein
MAGDENWAVTKARELERQINDTIERHWHALMGDDKIRCIASSIAGPDWEFLIRRAMDGKPAKVHITMYNGNQDG